MSLSSIVNILQESSLTKELVERCEREEKLYLIDGSRAARALVTSAIAKNTKKHFIKLDLFKK